jgi:hypothetical protein
MDGPARMWTLAADAWRALDEVMERAALAAAPAQGGGDE